MRFLFAPSNTNLLRSTLAKKINQAGINNTKKSQNHL